MWGRGLLSPPKHLGHKPENFLECGGNGCLISHLYKNHMGPPISPLYKHHGRQIKPQDFLARSKKPRSESGRGSCFFLPLAPPTPGPSRFGAPNPGPALGPDHSPPRSSRPCARSLKPPPASAQPPVPRLPFPPTPFPRSSRSRHPARASRTSPARGSASSEAPPPGPRPQVSPEAPPPKPRPMCPRLPCLPLPAVKGTPLQVEPWGCF